MTYAPEVGGLLFDNRCLVEGDGSSLGHRRGEGVGDVVSRTVGKSNFWPIAKGGEKGVGCGGWDTRKPPSYACPSCHTAYVTPIHCKERTCPVCGELWAKREAVRASWYIEENLKAKRNGVIRRVIVSPGKDWTPKDDDEMISVRKDVIKYLESEGWQGLYLVFHPYRDDESGSFNVVGGHFQGFGIKRRSNGESRPPRGWVYKNMPLRGGLYKKIKYDLDHCAVVDGRHSIVWYGCLSYISSTVKMSTFKGNDPDDLEHCINKACPKCGTPLITVSWSDWYGCGGDMQRAFRVEYMGEGESGPPSDMFM